MSKKLAIVLVLAGFVMGSVLTMGVGANAKGKVSLKKVFKSAKVATKKIGELKGLIRQVNTKVAGVDSKVGDVGGKVDGTKSAVDLTKISVDANRDRINRYGDQTYKNYYEGMDASWNSYIACHIKATEVFGESVADSICANPVDRRSGTSNSSVQSLEFQEDTYKQYR